MQTHFYFFFYMRLPEEAIAPRILEEGDRRTVGGVEEVVARVDANPAGLAGKAKAGRYRWQQAHQAHQSPPSLKGNWQSF
jgi:hypothetical protein